jgi:hypothetical protein
MGFIHLKIHTDSIQFTFEVMLMHKPDIFRCTVLVLGILLVFILRILEVMESILLHFLHTVG